MRDRRDTEPDGAEVVASPYGFYRWLRDRHPVYYWAATEEYFVTRFEDVECLTLDWRRFSSQPLGQGHDHFASMDPPRHDLHRASVARLFTPRKVALLGDGITQMCRELLEQGRRQPGFDLAEEFAAVIPSQVVTALVGLPPALREPFRRQSLAIAKLTTTPKLYQALRDLQALTWEAIGDGRDLPAEGILHHLLAGDGVPEAASLSRRDVVGICTNLVLAGTDTASNLITNGLVILGSDAALRRRVLADRSRVGDFVEETLRFESPVQWLRRTTTEAVELHGVLIPPRAAIRLYWGAANRDERVISRPEQFDLDRRWQRHLAFGHGLHFCVGAALARLEGRIAIETALDVFGDFELDHSGLRRLGSSMFRGYEHLRLGGP